MNRRATLCLCMYVHGITAPYLQLVQLALNLHASHGKLNCTACRALQLQPVPGTQAHRRGHLLLRLQLQKG